MHLYADMLFRETDGVKTYVLPPTHDQVSTHVVECQPLEGDTVPEGMIIVILHNITLAPAHYDPPITAPIVYDEPLACVGRIRETLKKDRRSLADHLNRMSCTCGRARWHEEYEIEIQEKEIETRVAKLQPLKDHMEQMTDLRDRFKNASDKARATTRRQRTKAPEEEPNNDV